MRHTSARIALYGLIIPFFLVSSLARAEAKTSKVDCDKGKTVQDEINNADPGDVIEVTGTCSEHVDIPEEVHRVTLDGQGMATLTAPTSDRPIIRIRGTGIMVKRFTITGGRGGIQVITGGTATIDGNLIQSSVTHGILLNRSSFALIINNTIQNNGSQGIHITDGAAGRIGFTGPSGARIARPNTIQDNNNGIFVTGSSSARIFSNTIRDNTQDGVRVDRVSHASIASNSIDNNGRDGIFVSRNSGVNLGADVTVDPVEHDPNTGNNGRNGVRCRINSSADGRLGALTGNTAAKNFSGDCVDSLN